MAPKKQIHLNFFDASCAGNHTGIKLWRDPTDNVHTKDRIEYYLWLEKLAEKGKMTSLFFADTYAVDQTYQGKLDATYRGGFMVAQLNPVIILILGRTLEEAEAKYKRYRKCVDYQGEFAKTSSPVNFDFSKQPLDEPFVFDDAASDNSIHTILKTIKRYDQVGTLKPRKLGEMMALCGFAPKFLGTPKMVTDLMERRVNEADIDGFNVSCECVLEDHKRAFVSVLTAGLDVSNPESYEDIVELVIPELQRKGLMWMDYAVPEGTFQENLHRKPSETFLPESHPAAQFRYDNLKGKYTDAHGHVVIDRVAEMAVQEVSKGVKSVTISAAEIKA